MACKKLCELRRGSCGHICHIEDDCPMKARLLDMGFTPGCPVTLERRGPFGGPYAVRVCGRLLSLRKEEAEHILLEEA